MLRTLALLLGAILYFLICMTSTTYAGPSTDRLHLSEVSLRDGLAARDNCARRRSR
jgi:hypothetical protein